jgi:hypothetical protein
MKTVLALLLFACSGLVHALPEAVRRVRVALDT